MRLDAHQHFWRYTPAEYPWMTDPLAALRRDYLPDDLQPLLTRSGLDGSIAVQACPTVSEARWLLELADAAPSHRGDVGWVDLGSEAVDAQLTELSGHPKFVGVRHVVQDEPDDRFLLRPDFLRGIGRLKAFDLTYDLLIYPRQLPAALEFVRHFPEQPFVLDHGAKPLIRDRVLAPWQQQIRELAQHPNVWCKASGLVTEADWHGWKPDEFRPYLDVLFDAFGVDRLMFGSDWPVCTLAGSYDEVYSLLNQYTAALSADDRAKIFGANAARFYGIA
jgi:L-fuconolactonase